MSYPTIETRNGFAIRHVGPDHPMYPNTPYYVSHLGTHHYLNKKGEFMPRAGECYYKTVKKAQKAIDKIQWT